MNIKNNRLSADELSSAFERLRDQLNDASLTSAHRRSLEKQLQGLLTNLGRLLDHMDPISQPISVFDPADPKVVGRFVALALVAQKRHPIGDIPRTYGSGVYALYYNGNFDLYRPLSKTETPIYVGQAAPSSNHARLPREQGDKLFSRLSTHKRNISKAASLSVDDFEVRSLVVQSGWETAAEDYLIHLFQPIWNSETGILYGLGKHGDSAETRANKRSPWDTLHPGRTWAVATTLDAKSVEQITNELALHFQEHPVYNTLDDVLLSFIEELRQI